MRTIAIASNGSITFKTDLKNPHGWYDSLYNCNQMEQNHGRPGSLSLLEFDDHNDTHRLVCGLMINHIQWRVTHKKTSGTYTDWTDDWKRNLQSDWAEVLVISNLCRLDTYGAIRQAIKYFAGIAIFAKYKHLFQSRIAERDKNSVRTYFDACLDGVDFFL